MVRPTGTKKSTLPLNFLSESLKRLSWDNVKQLSFKKTRIVLTEWGPETPVVMTAEYIPTEICLKEEYERRELQQKRHYFLFSQLQNMARELPGKYQQRLPYDLLSSLANALIDGTVFKIVQSLKEVQEWEEKAMFHQRSKVISDHKAQKHELQKKHKTLLQECRAKPHNLALTKAQIDREMETTTKRCEEEIKKKDQKIIMQLDQKVMDQQSTLEKAGVPGFYVTNKPQDIKLQMYLLEFIVRVSQVEIPS